MWRMTLVCLAAGMLGQLTPEGCPTGATSTDDELVVRETIATEASGPESVQVGQVAILTATATADVEGGAISYYWAQIAGPGIRIYGASRANASFQAPSLSSDQTLRFLVTTTNERGDAGRAEVDVLVNLDPNYGAEEGDSGSGPVARAGVDRTVAGGTDFTLDGSNSRGDDLTYQWRQTAGETAEIEDADTVRATVTAPAYNADGQDPLEFELEVLDRLDRRDTDRVTITLREPTAEDETEPYPRVRIVTSMGDILVELDRENAPISVNNFLNYVDDEFYDNTIFHRVIADFVIQGGGFDADLEQKETEDPITNESDNGLKNSRGTIAMARTSDADSATSQFYINLVDNSSLNATGGADGYAVFGKVIDGMDVVDAIGEVATESRDGFNDVPIDDVIIETIERVASGD